MSRIQSSVGLITGIPIEETVNKLMQVAAQPKNTLNRRTQFLESERLAVTQLSSLLLALRFETNKLGSESLFTTKQLASSNTAALTATLAPDGNPKVGSHLFTPVQTASAQQFLSQNFAADAKLGAGSFTFQTGGFVDKGISLEELNGGAGVQRGRIRVTDRAGNHAIIDLTFARTIDDVLRAISDNTAINVTAVAAGNAVKLIDHTGGGGTLSVQNVAGGSTATDLGLAGISVAAAEATGSGIFTLHAQTKLSSLNDGTGVQLRSGADLAVTLADQSVVNIDLGAAETLGDVIAAINAVQPAKLSAAIAADGNRLELTDLTSGGGAFAVASAGSGTAAEDLGLTPSAVGDTITGRRLVSGLRDTLLASLKGGQGLGTLGSIEITNRNSVSSTVDLSAAETLGDVIAAVNSQAAGVTARVNSARNGILLVDTTGGTTSNLIVADADATDTATALGVTANAAVTAVNSGTLQRRALSHGTLLSSLNGGAGIHVGDFKITDSNGKVDAVDLNPVGNVARTIGDVIDRINALANVGVEARINDRGDGILLIDTAGGSGTMTVAAVGSHTTAKDLRILGSAQVIDVDGVPTQIIDGTAAVTVTMDADDTLADLVTTINELGHGITASLLHDGTGQRLSLSVDQSGAAGAVLIDTTDSPLVVQQISRARDALLLYGTADSPGSSILVSSATNEFKNVIDGVDLAVNQSTLEPVTITVKTTSTPIVDAARQFVNAYNSIRETLDETTAFDAEELTTGILFGTREALRIEADLARVLTSRFFGVGHFESLEAVGIGINDKGRLVLNEAKLIAAFTNDPDGLQRLFTDEDLGVAAKLGAVIEQLAGEGASLLTTRSQTLTDIITSNLERIERMDQHLERQRERMLAEFFRIESTVAEMQRQLSALASLQILPPLTSRGSNSLFGN